MAQDALHSRETAVTVIGNAGGVGNLSSSALRDVCKLLYLSDIGADDLLVGRINTKLDGKVKSHTHLSNAEKQALGRL
jgi:hypothetical protein